jgi:succinyl-CoA synthetase beta subunit
LQGLPQTCQAINALWFHAQRSGRAPAQPPQTSASALRREELVDRLREHGLRGPAQRIVPDVDGAVRAAEEIGFPVALKIESPDISHKTEVGGVALGLRSGEDVRSAAARIVESARRAAPAARIDGFLVQEMANGVEAILGVREDQQFGPMLVVGTGGVMVELFTDICVRLLPLDRAELRRAIEKLKLARLLAGFRGAPKADFEALLDAAEGLARFYLEHRAQIADLEINPLIVRAEGQGVVAVDVRPVWKEGG